MTAADRGLDGRRVLVIEDEYMVAMLIEDMLRDLGCEVAGAASRFDDALDKARSLPLDVAVLDINLAGRPTFEIAQALRKRGVPFVFASGYGSAGVPEPLRDAPFLQKPFRRGDVNRALHAALEKAG
jgi:CheY-like chemotaxis protein